MSDKTETDITAYSLYSKQAKARTKINPLEDIYPKLPQKNIRLFMQIRLGTTVEKCSTIKQP